MNNNRGNTNNRRRGRGNRQQGGGGGQQLNRIDSRARGNAPQLLEKYRKLAQDAHLNGDRVQSEYYLQFADHYFRVIADARVRQEEQRRPRDERWEGGEESDDSGEFSVESDFPSFEQPSYQRRERDDTEIRRPRERDDRPRQRPSHDSAPDDESASDEDTRGNEAEPASDESGEPNPYEPQQNPFVREGRGTRGLKPRREDRRPRRDERDAPAADNEAPAALDPSSLPPAISATRAEPEPEAAVESAEAEAPAKPRRGRPRRKPLADDAGETAEAVN